MLRLTKQLNPSLVIVSILNTLGTPEKLWLSSVFRGYKMRILARNRSIDEKQLFLVATVITLMEHNFQRM